MRKIHTILLCGTMLLSYLLGVSGGHVALWEGDDPTPVHIFPYALSEFPVHVQKALTEGISIDDPKELVEILKDYLS